MTHPLSEKGHSPSECKRISDRLRARGFVWCTAERVAVVLAGGSLEDAALESAILQEADR